MTMLAPRPRDRRLKFLQNGVFSLTLLTTIMVCVPVVIVTAYVVSKGAGAITWDFLFTGPERGGREGNGGDREDGDGRPRDHGA